SFDVISEKIADDIDVESKIQDVSLEQIVTDDLFKVSNFKVIQDLIAQLLTESISTDNALKLIKERENKFWYSKFEYLYTCLEYGIEFLALVKNYQNITFTSFEEGVKQYTETDYQVDYLYRKFIWSYRKASQASALSALVEKIEKSYSNDWLLNYNNNWQSIVNDLDTWNSDRLKAQSSFYNLQVAPALLKKNQRVFVIVSDAFRYENGVELSQRLIQENKYQASMDYMISSLPSYTQLGMASLLPHKNIQIQENSDAVLVDELSTAGTSLRAKILAQNTEVRTTAITAKDFMNISPAKDGKEFTKNHDLIYIYHNQIDKVGDDKTTEDKVFDAVEAEINYLIDVIKRVFNINGSKILLTSDHGFIYQDHPLEDSDFSESNHEGEVWKTNRRFVIGQDLQETSSTKAFTSEQLRLKGGANVLIPKSINRLRVKGAGSRFVHGGSSLQEVIVPLISISKKRKDTVSQVSIDILKTTDRITTNILPVSFIQSESVDQEFLPRKIRVALHAENGELLSDQFSYTFDSEEENTRQREVKHRFQLTSRASSHYRNQRIKLILEEPVEGTTKWKVYKEFFYTVMISYSNDFDEF
ncbi:MAG: BREX-1 system phosphatase PglZ type A, partial [Cytophagales bacterium]|nr:BREX-1 system phosphatase PglZ type A [Cytophagales bacterium]